MSPRPVIGITTYLTTARWSYWEAPAALIPASYVARSRAPAGVPLLVPPTDQDSFAETLDAVDGLVFSGGSDLDPELYGEDAHPETTGVIRERDDFELALMKAALDRDLPVLAICRGSQVLNVALGGGIEQHVPDRVGTDVHKEVPGRVRRARRRGGARHPAGGDRGRPHAREVPPPSGVRHGRPRAARDRARRGRDTRGARGPGAPLHAGRPLAPGRGRGSRALRSAGRPGRRTIARTAAVRPRQP